MTLKEISEVDKLLKKEFQAHSAPIIELIKAQTDDPFCVLVGTILSSRTKDACTTGAVKRLFATAQNGMFKPSDLERLSEKEIEKLTKLGFNNLPVCIAKTQFSFSADAKRYGSVEGFEINIKDIELNAGSGFVVALAGDIMRMPGLSKNPQASNIRLAEDGNVEGIV